MLRSPTWAFLIPHLSLLASPDLNDVKHAVDAIIAARALAQISISSALHIAHKSPAVDQCCCADICSDQSQEITNQLVTVNC